MSGKWFTARWRDPSRIPRIRKVVHPQELSLGLKAALSSPLSRTRILSLITFMIKSCTPKGERGGKGGERKGKVPMVA